MDTFEIPNHHRLRSNRLANRIAGFRASQMPGYVSARLLPILILRLLLATAVMAAGVNTSFATGNVSTDGNSILVQSTTSTANSGLYNFLLPRFNQNHDIKVKVVAVGTGQAIKNASNCDADVLLVHARTAEQAFVDKGYGVARYDLMYNDFVIIGPASDPANIASSDNTVEALQRIAATESLFASRGDDSGTHKKELSLWQSANVIPETDWYRSTGSGMGATLNTGLGLNAYVLTDRASWITFGNKRESRILHQGDSALFNQYGIIRVNEAMCPNVNVAASQTFIDWMLSESGQSAIGEFQVDGQQLFFPNAGR